MANARTSSLARLPAASESLLKLSALQFNLLFLAVAVVLTEVVVFGIDFAWDGRLNMELQVAGLITPLIVAPPVLGLFAVLMNSLQQEAGKRRSAEQNLNEAQRIAHIGNWVLELSDNTLSWSDEIYRIVGIEPKGFEPSYQAFLECVHPDDRETVDTAFTHSLENRQPYEITHRLLLPNGRITYVHERGETTFAEDGKPLRTIGTIQDVSERVRLENELTRRANTDPLTGLFNRYRFDESIRRHMYTSQRYEVPLSLLMLDIDHFKRINDNHGHASGDQVLIHVTEVIRTVIRDSDIFARWGGEEFLILAPYTTLEAATVLAERIRSCVEASRYGDIPVTISIGVTEFGAGETHEPLLKRADEALYQAKVAGRNRVTAKPGRADATFSAEPSVY